MIYPLVRELAADGIPITVTCRVLSFTPQAFHKWRANPVSRRDWSDVIRSHGKTVESDTPIVCAPGG